MNNVNKTLKNPRRLMDDGPDLRRPSRGSAAFPQRGFCGKTGDLLMMENPGPACLGCVGLDDLEFLPAGDALLPRRAKANTKRFAVVVRFSRTRRRYERQGLLVEPSALADTPELSPIGR